MKKKHVLIAIGVLLLVVVASIFLVLHDSGAPDEYTPPEPSPTPTTPNTPEQPEPAPMVAVGFREYPSDSTFVAMHLVDVDDFNVLLEFQELEGLSVSHSSFDERETPTLDLNVLIDVLEQLPNFQGLRFIYIDINDLTPLTRLSQLIWLSIDRTTVTDISPLAEMQQLEGLTIVRNYDLNDITPLFGLTSLRDLSIEVNYIDDISWLANLTNLEHIRIQQEQLPGGIRDISPLSELGELRHLALRINQIEDLSPLAGLYRLEYLDLMGNQIHDISPLVGLTNLRYLELGGSPIEDWSPVEGIPDLLINPESSMVGHPEPEYVGE